MTESRWRLHLLLVLLFAIGGALFFVREPGFGDDFTYWSFAFRLHEHGWSAWYRGSFHDLRWPVWACCWLLQSVFGPGLSSYYGEPMLYLMGGAALAFAFGRLLRQSLPLAWACAIAFLFFPLLDTVSYRPMPDLSEGVWGAAAMVCWWALMRAPTVGRSLCWAALTGACVFLIESNRITGVFIVPVLFLCTLFVDRRHFFWLVAAGGFAALFYGLECVFYHWLFQDWLHDIHANLGGKDHKGIEIIPLWQLPTRFLNGLWKGGILPRLYCVLTLIGIVRACNWRTAIDAAAPSEMLASRLGPRQLARVLVIWLITLYLEYACAPQSVWPWKPLIRDADRFLCGLAIPMSILTVLGLVRLFEFRAVRVRKAGRWLPEHPLAAVTLGAVALLLVTWHTHGFFNLGFVPEMSRYMRSRPAGTKVFTHDSMRAIAFLVDAEAARRFDWRAEHEILQRLSWLEKEASHANEFWYARKLVWLNARKQIERSNLLNAADEPIAPVSSLASYFDTPERQWRLVNLLAKEGDTPDLIFYRHRTPSDPPPLILIPESPELAQLFPKLPMAWPGSPDEQIKNVSWPVPAALRGKFVRVEIEASSEEIESLDIDLRFQHGGQPDAQFALRPYLQRVPAKEFFALQIPQDSDDCEIQFKLQKNATGVRFTGFRAIVE